MGSGLFALVVINECVQKPDKAEDGIPRLNILEVQRLIRFMPKVVIAVVPGWAVGGGHSLHVTCDLTLTEPRTRIFKQTDTDVASFDGFGSATLHPSKWGQKELEIFFLRQKLFGSRSLRNGMINAVIPHNELEKTAYQWAQKYYKKGNSN